MNSHDGSILYNIGTHNDHIILTTKNPFYQRSGLFKDFPNLVRQKSMIHTILGMSLIRTQPSVELWKAHK